MEAALEANEVDEDQLIEERRRRRQEILAKHQQGQAAQPGTLFLAHCFSINPGKGHTGCAQGTKLVCVRAGSLSAYCSPDILNWPIWLLLHSTSAPHIFRHLAGFRT